MKKLNITIFGVTGLVGIAMLRELERRKSLWKGREIHLLPVASENSVLQKKTVAFDLHRIPIVNSKEALNRMDESYYALLAVDTKVSQMLVPKLRAKGVTIIDNSSAWRLETGVPLVIPEINRHHLTASKGLIANPNCSTIQMLLATFPLIQAFAPSRLSISTYQSVSGAGKKGTEQLHWEEKHGPSPDFKNSSPFVSAIHRNVIPVVGSIDGQGWSEEERKIILESSKILGNQTPEIEPTCVRVPVPVGHSQSIILACDRPVTYDEVKSCYKHQNRIIFCRQKSLQQFPTPVDILSNDMVYVSRVRIHPQRPNVVYLWTVADNLYVGAATNAVNILGALV